MLCLSFQVIKTKINPQTLTPPLPQLVDGQDSQHRPYVLWVGSEGQHCSVFLCAVPKAGRGNWPTLLFLYLSLAVAPQQWPLGSSSWERGVDVEKRPSFKTMSSVSKETLEEGLDKLFYTY